jgi:hypothetical protein
MNLWLDDVRPAPDGWVHAKTIQEAMPHLESGQVEQASLDHDLGMCETCLGGRTYEEWLNENWRGENRVVAMPNCEHYGTGYTLVCWMEETGHWPKQKPTVHSANPVGRRRMQQVIDKRDW